MNGKRRGKIFFLCICLAAVLTACSAGEDAAYVGDGSSEAAAASSEAAATSEEDISVNVEEEAEKGEEASSTELVYTDNMTGVTEDGFHFFTRAGYVFISGIPDGTRRLEIPEELGGMPVAGIDELRWGDLEEVEEIVIPESCFWIAEDDILGSEWFHRQYDLENMVDANGEPLGDYLYCGNVLIGYTGEDTVLNIPEGTLGIGTGAFDISLLREEITDITFPEGLIGLARQSCFALHDLVRLELPETLEIIGEEAFKACHVLENVTLPEGIKIVDAGAFNGTPWLSEQIRGSEDEFVLIGPGTLVSYNGTEEDVVIPEGVVTVDEGIFSGDEEIRSVVFPSTVYSVGLAAFRDCTGLETVELNEGLRMIGNGAFTGCPCLETLELPSTVWVASGDWYDEGTEITGKDLEEVCPW